MERLKDNLRKLLEALKNLLKDPTNPQLRAEFNRAADELQKAAKDLVDALLGRPVEVPN